ncbi:hypothetical protein DINM_005047 [Dirofilaria immitis]|nr:hypothetical protein [Dirofilaria immitis]
MTSDVAKMTLDAAIRGKELAEQSAAIGAKMTSDVAKMTLDTAIRGKELAEQGAAIGTKMTSDAAKMTYDVTNRGRELAEFSVAISAKMTQDVASKGLQIAEGTIHVASKGKEMIKDSLTAASNATLDLSETALEGAMQVTGLNWNPLWTNNPFENNKKMRRRSKGWMRKVEHKSVHNSFMPVLKWHGSVLPDMNLRVQVHVYHSLTK